MGDWERELSLILDDQTKLLAKLLKCESEKTDFLAKGDIDNINKIIEKEQELSLQCRNIEKHRENYLNNNNLNKKTLRELCAMSKPEYRDLFEQTLFSLTDVVKKLKKTNDLNCKLTKSRLEFYGKVRALVTKPVYGYDGAASHSTGVGKSIIDRKI